MAISLACLQKSQNFLRGTVGGSPGPSHPQAPHLGTRQPGRVMPAKAVSTRGAGECQGRLHKEQGSCKEMRKGNIIPKKQSLCGRFQKQLEVDCREDLEASRPRWAGSAYSRHSSVLGMHSWCSAMASCPVSAHSGPLRMLPLTPRSVALEWAEPSACPTHCVVACVSQPKGSREMAQGQDSSAPPLFCRIF